MMGVTGGLWIMIYYFVFKYVQVLNHFHNYIFKNYLKIKMCFRF